MKHVFNSGGKRYKTNFNIEKFFEQVQQAISTIFKKGDTMSNFWSDDETKKSFIAQKTSKI